MNPTDSAELTKTDNLTAVSLAVDYRTRIYVFWGVAMGFSYLP